MPSGTTTVFGASRASLASSLLWLLVMGAVASTAAIARADTAGIAAAFAATGPDGAAPFDHSAWDRLLSAHVATGKDGVNRVDYTRLKADGQAALKAYLAALEAADPARLGAAEQLAYWANLYNAKTLDLVLDRYPVGSIREVRLPDPSGVPQDGPWKAKTMRVSGIALSLDDIANTILRPRYMARDPRGHYLLNCLSVGCPNLLPQAITGARLPAQLDAAARAFVNHPRGVKVADREMHVSSLYVWYAEDFGGLAGTLAHLRRHAAPALADRLDRVEAISGDSYDWTLNDAAGG